MSREQTDAERRAQTEHEAESARLYEEEKIKREAAEKRGEQLLLDNLSKKERIEYLEKQHVIVHGRTNRYRIRRGRTGNVDVIGRDGRITHRLCAHPGAHPRRR